MGVSIGFGLGPFRVSKRVTPRRVLPTARERRILVEARERKADRRAAMAEQVTVAEVAMPAAQYRRARRTQVIAAVTVTLLVTLLVGPVALVLPGLPLAIGLVVHHRHVARRRRGVDEIVAEKPVIDPAAEAAFARAYGLPDAVWEDDAPTVALPIVR